MTIQVKVTTIPQIPQPPPEKRYDILNLNEREYLAIISLLGGACQKNTKTYRDSLYHQLHTQAGLEGDALSDRIDELHPELSGARMGNKTKIWSAV